MGIDPMNNISIIIRILFAVTIISIEGGYNWKVATTTCPCLVQPP
jgi:hypothetical protein